jgi:hypothetical protein
MLDGDALNGDWTKRLPPSDMYLITMEGVLEYFSKEQAKTCLNMLCDCFPHGYLLAELHSPFLEKNSKHHGAVKNTNATFGWGTKSGREYLELEPRMTLVSETSYNEEMKKYTIRGRLFAIIGKNMNNRLAVFKWRSVKKFLRFVLNFVPVVTGMTLLPAWICVFNLLPLFLVQAPFSIPGAGNIAGAVMCLGWFILFLF